MWFWYVTSFFHIILLIWQLALSESLSRHLSTVYKRRGGEESEEAVLIASKLDQATRAQPASQLPITTRHNTDPVLRHQSHHSSSQSQASDPSHPPPSTTFLPPKRVFFFTLKTFHKIVCRVWGDRGVVCDYSMIEIKAELRWEHLTQNWCGEGASNRLTSTPRATFTSPRMAVEIAHPFRGESTSSTHLFCASLPYNTEISLGAIDIQLLLGTEWLVEILDIQ